MNAAIGEALGKVYVEQYFAGDSKAKMLQMVNDIEDRHGPDIDQIDWMSPATKARAKEKLARRRRQDRLSRQVARLLQAHHRARRRPGQRSSAPTPSRTTASSTKSASPSTIRVGHDSAHRQRLLRRQHERHQLPRRNPAAALLRPHARTIAVNYGHIGAVIGHELTHGFDDEGRKFDAKGNLNDWWTPDDLKNFTARTDCEVNEYGSFTAVDDVHINGKLTLGENTADNGGLLLAYLAYMQRAKDNHINLAAKSTASPRPQRFYIAFAQNWCQNTRPEAVRDQVLKTPTPPTASASTESSSTSPASPPPSAANRASPWFPSTAAASGSCPILWIWVPHSCRVLCGMGGIGCTLFSPGRVGFGCPIHAHLSANGWGKRADIPIFVIASGP